MALAPLRDLQVRRDVRGGAGHSLETPPGGISFREYVEMRFKSLEKATESDRIEIQRRLAEVNKVRDDAIRDRVLYITKDTYAGTETARALWRETYETELKAISDRLLVIETRSVTRTSLLGILFTGLQIVIGMILYWMMHK